MDFSLPMALFDFLPVLLYLVSSVIMQRCLYGRMTTGGFAVYCTGTIMVTVAGIFKATWKLLYALEICDFQALNQSFMPMQAVGFLLAAAALLAYVFSPRGRTGEKLFAVPVFASSMPFVGAMVLGVLGLQTGYCVLAARKKRTGAVVLHALCALLELGMGYLSSRDFTKASMNWIAEGVNFAAMLCLYLGVRDLQKHVFND